MGGRDDLAPTGRLPGGGHSPPYISYWGRLWQINTSNSSTTLRSVRYTWDNNGNMVQRQDVLAGQTELFGYDFLDRLTSVSGAYNQNYSYNKIGNILSMNGSSYTYGSKPHAVTAVGTTNYSYDANGNMLTRGNQTITWNWDNMPISVASGRNISTFVYDGDGNRVMKIEGDQTTIYVNQYYEKNITTGNVTSHYYLGGKEVAYKTNAGLRYVHQDSLSSTSVTTSSTGAVVASIKYFPFGGTRSQSGTLDTDKKFTGQRLDQTGLYYYNARYYDATIGRFISPDSIVQSLANPQTLNRYSYCLNNPLKYVDPSGHSFWSTLGWIALGVVCTVAVAAVALTVVGIGVGIVAAIGDLTAATTIGGIGVGLLHVAEVSLPLMVPFLIGGAYKYQQDNSISNGGTDSSGFNGIRIGSGGWVWAGPDVIDANGIGYTFEEWNSGSGGSSTWNGGWEWTGPDVIDSDGTGYTFDEWSAHVAAEGSGSGLSGGSGGGDWSGSDSGSGGAFSNEPPLDPNTTDGW
jgi:RHS repeat-associated protein